MITFLIGAAIGVVAGVLIARRNSKKVKAVVAEAKKLKDAAAAKLK